jgi:hypothetical protein
MSSSLYTERPDWNVNAYTRKYDAERVPPIIPGLRWHASRDLLSGWDYNVRT